ncbi:MAG: transcriptional regulator NrdR [Clostridia bacterium]
MKCMYCGSLDSKVVDSRLNEDGTSIRRRRECVNCGKRFTTYETVEYTPIMVVKKSGNRQAFDINKIRNGILKACEKRPVSMYDIERVINNIQKQIFNSLEQEITSTYIGDLVMHELKELDEVAYVRFASVHRQFKDINTLLNEIESLVKLKDSLVDADKKKSKK